MHDKIANSGGEQSSHDLWKVTNIATGEHRVMKCYKKFDHEDLISELCAARDLTPHPNIMRFDKVIETDAEAFVLCEFLDGEDLMAFYEQGVDEATAKHLFHQIFSAFAHLHGQCGVLHNDVKLENLFVVGTGGTTAQLQAKIIDFGLASFPGKKPKVANPGTCGFAYCAPELLNQAQKSLLPVLPHATKEMDIFRLGVVLYVLLMQQFPYPPIPLAALAEPSQPARPLSDESFKKESHKVALGKWRALSPECKELLGRLLAFDPKARPTAQAALEHAWFHI
jgi:serine/threonine protein kinase